MIKLVITVLIVSSTMSMPAYAQPLARSGSVLRPVAYDPPPPPPGCFYVLGKLLCNDEPIEG